MSIFLLDINGYKFSEFVGIEIIDNQNRSIGRLIDGILRFTSDGLELKYLLVGDSKLTEFIERIGIKEDKDPLVSINEVKSISTRRIKLNISETNIKGVVVDQILKHNEYKYSKLRSLNVIDNNDKNLGEIEIYYLLMAISNLC